ncbi:hypothetical protein OG563_38710 [Nocardia vinacea]|uniref:Uncharacterized protein n=1 Tax=Nocardia vinacea TaxID=96468 RepID=A0ABZ1YTE0_9NOCA|nr:hypothetical protein [Nocardia vinacea]
MRNLIRPVLLTAFGIGSTLVGSATASADNVVCFINAIEPWKTGHNSIASINFGFKVHCTGTPALRNVTTKLWRYDANDGKQYLHSERNDTSTNPDVET